MEGKRRANTKKDAENPNSWRQTTSDTPGTLAPGWRPGRDPANIEINLGPRRSQRLRARQDEPSKGVPQTDERPPGTTSADNEANRLGEQRVATPSSFEIASQASSGIHAITNRERRPVPPGWEPPLVIGASLGTNLSRLENAERSVLQWEAIIANTRRKQPLADLSGLEDQRDKARQEFEQMEESEENLVPFDELESTKRYRIRKRIDLLTASLERHECPASDTNIRAAIKAYQTGQIKCWDRWTLIYAGQLADFCPSYESFTLDREERLDRYHSQYGEGWLWYEPPLAPKGNHQTEQLMAATWAQSSDDSGLLTGYKPYNWEISMGFKRVKGFHGRFTQRLGKPGRSKNGKVLLYQTKLREIGSNERGPCFVEDDNDDTAPRVCFKMLLDSGATHPSLHDTDLKYIGIDRRTYPAQTHISISTAESSTAVARVYEMRVDVCRYNGESLVGDDPIFPNERRELGGIAPVMVLVKSTPDESEPLSEWYEEALENGEDVSEEAMAKRYKGSQESRLSGMLPFQVCYFAGAPGQPHFWFGEDRRDVLGADRMPGQQRWERHLKPKGVQRPKEVSHLDRPTVAFDHQMDGLKLLDTDSAADSRASVLIIDDAGGKRRVLMKIGEDPEETVLRKNPKRKIRTDSSTNAQTQRKRTKK
ncbi:hypothetical protein FVEN_g6283 [Fusarium venenatum]|uniref:Uncharacterized protein n=1 Tax=Fusarium venenatum TaxID=56646 RepID=A0A2L2T6H6_9HYPO|nr:uncharacterized protein FVRRES_01801 [Fusarium venenatum]KAG8355915.1 hypothetical protein FVEN_g6283 [Fusarium venenatum]CEI65289.1 unnamed protein product [Fusarium venenatum]